MIQHNVNKLLAPAHDATRNSNEGIIMPSHNLVHNTHPVIPERQGCLALHPNVHGTYSLGGVSKRAQEGLLAVPPSAHTKLSTGAKAHASLQAITSASGLQQPVLSCVFSRGDAHHKRGGKTGKVSTAAPSCAKQHRQDTWHKQPRQRGRCMPCWHQTVQMAPCDFVTHVMWVCIMTIGQGRGMRGQHKTAQL